MDGPWYCGKIGFIAGAWNDCRIGFGVGAGNDCKTGFWVGGGNDLMIGFDVRDWNDCIFVFIVGGRYDCKVIVNVDNKCGWMSEIKDEVLVELIIDVGWNSIKKLVWTQWELVEDSCRILSDGTQ